MPWYHHVHRSYSSLCSSFCSHVHCVHIPNHSTYSHINHIISRIVRTYYIVVVEPFNGLKCHNYVFKRKFKRQIYTVYQVLANVSECNAFLRGTISIHVMLFDVSSEYRQGIHRTKRLDTTGKLMNNMWGTAFMAHLWKRKRQITIKQRLPLNRIAFLRYFLMWMLPGCRVPQHKMPRYLTKSRQPFRKIPSDQCLRIHSYEYIPK